MYLDDLETLENIIDSIVALEDDPLIMDDNMLTDFIETTLEQIYEYVNENPTLISDPEFHSICVNEIRVLCLTQFEEQILLNDVYEEELYNYIDEALEIFSSSVTVVLSSFLTPIVEFNELFLDMLIFNSF
jgi:hypothetical protein